MEEYFLENIPQNATCRVIAVKCFKKSILRLFLKVKIDDDEFIAFLDCDGKLWEISNIGESLLASAVSKNGFIILNDEIRNKPFKYKDLEIFLEDVEKLL